MMEMDPEEAQEEAQEKRKKKKKKKKKKEKRERRGRGKEEKKKHKRATGRSRRGRRQDPSSSPSSSSSSTSSSDSSSDFSSNLSMSEDEVMDLDRPLRRSRYAARDLARVTKTIATMMSPSNLTFTIENFDQLPSPEARGLFLAANNDLYLMLKAFAGHTKVEQHTHIPVGDGLGLLLALISINERRDSGQEYRARQMFAMCKMDEGMPHFPVPSNWEDWPLFMARLRRINAWFLRVCVNRNAKSLMDKGDLFRRMENSLPKRFDGFKVELREERRRLRREGNPEPTFDEAEDLLLAYTRRVTAGAGNPNNTNPEFDMRHVPPPLGANGQMKVRQRRKPLSPQALAASGCVNSSLHPLGPTYDFEDVSGSDETDEQGSLAGAASGGVINWRGAVGSGRMGSGPLDFCKIVDHQSNRQGKKFDLSKGEAWHLNCECMEAAPRSATQGR